MHIQIVAGFKTSKEREKKKTPTNIAACSLQSISRQVKSRQRGAGKQSHSVWREVSRAFS